MHYLELAEAELARFRADMDALDMRPPLAEPRATEAIDGMIDMVGRAARRRATRTSRNGTVYFDVSTFPRFGELSHYRRDEMVELARERGGNPDDPHRRDAARLRALAAVARPTSRRGARRSASVAPAGTSSAR